jgi:predicted transcriptional regulator
MNGEMLDWDEFNSHHNKVIRAIRSCETLEQLENAEKFSQIAIRFHISKMKQDPKSLRNKYKTVIEMSSELMNEAISDHRKKIIRDGK